MNATSFFRAPHLLGLFFVLGVFLSGCKSNDDDVPENLKVPRLMVESRGINYGALTTDSVQLPLSGTKIALKKKPLVNEFDIINVELVQVELGRAVLIQTSELGARALYRGSVTNNGGRIVLMVNDTAVGARLINGAIEDGNFYTFVEMDDESLSDLVLELKETISYLQEKM